ncbi:hypothetical protein L1049_024088 [Liquidambar formosana]|uniref:Peptidase S8/S53 domain-containing protein n=1 Tax=Liquidambar formosana TaxID=63359 RepID=A0AAP0RUQ5_LIQFO
MAESSQGKDVIIGLVDTGIWPESASFSDIGITEVPARWKGECMKGTSFNSSMCNKNLIGARFYKKGLLSNKPNVTISMDSARDTDGHGTHTSSIAAGNYVEGASFFGCAQGTARGMAPLAHVGMYKGIFVAASVGNGGPSFRNLHNGTPWLLDVAAGTIDCDFTGIFSLRNGVKIIGSSLYHGNSSISQSPLVFMEACDGVQKLKQIKNAVAAGVAGGVFITNSFNLDFLTQTSIPATFLSPKDGQTTLNYIKRSSKPRASMEFPAPTVAAYSSGGPSPSCPSILKPDLMAPGSLVLASWSESRPVPNIGTKDVFTKFNIISGTSMSCPHAAGVAALLKGAHSEWSTAAV